LNFAQCGLVNSRIFQYLWNEIQGVSSTCSVFKYFQGLEFRINKIKYFQELSTMHGNPAKKWPYARILIW